MILSGRYGQQRKTERSVSLHHTFLLPLPSPLLPSPRSWRSARRRRLTTAGAVAEVAVVHSPTGMGGRSLAASAFVRAAMVLPLGGSSGPFAPATAEPAPSSMSSRQCLIPQPAYSLRGSRSTARRTDLRQSRAVYVGGAPRLKDAVLLL